MNDPFERTMKRFKKSGNDSYIAKVRALKSKVEITAKKVEELRKNLDKLKLNGDIKLRELEALLRQKE
jgi:ribosomal protein S21